MAKNRLFSFNSSGELVYRSNGRKAPSYYWSSNNTVYDSRTGRKAGTVSYKIKARSPKRKSSKNTPKPQKNTAKPQKNTAKSQKKKVTKKSAKKSAAKKAGKTTEVPGASDQTLDISEIENAEFTEDEYGYDDEFILAFAETVKENLNKGMPAWIQRRVQALDPFALWGAHQRNVYVFTCYYQYNPIGNVAKAANAARWLISIVEEIEKTGVKH